MGRLKGMPSRVWGKLEERILRTNYNKIPFKEVCELIPERSPGTIKVKAHKMGLTNSNPLCGLRYSSCDRKLLVEELIELRQQGERWADIESFYGHQIRSLVKHDTRYHKRWWTKEEDDYLIKNYMLISDRQIGSRLDRTRLGVMYRRQKLGLKKPQQWGNNNRITKNVCG